MMKWILNSSQKDKLTPGCIVTTKILNSIVDKRSQKEQSKQDSN